MILIKKLKLGALYENGVSLLGEGKNFGFLFSSSSSNNSSNDNNDADGKNDKLSKLLTTPSFYKSKKNQEYLKERGLYQHTQNYNFEQFKEYTKSLNSVIAEKQHIEETEKVVSEADRLPRRRRRVYDRPKYDWDISNYSSWRTFENVIHKSNDDSLPVVCKISASPALVVKVFGEGVKAHRSLKSTLEFDFEDSNLDLFLVYDYKSTTEFWGKNVENYDYENQENIPPRKRKQKWPTVEEFWSKSELVEFRVNCTPYADFRKFKKWFVEQIEKKKDEESFHEKVIKKYGAIDTYDDYNKEYKLNLEPAVGKYEQSYFFEEGEKTKVPAKSEKLTPARHPGDQYRLKEGRFVEEI